MIKILASRKRSVLCQLSRVEGGQGRGSAHHCLVQVRHQFPLLSVLRWQSLSQSSKISKLCPKNTPTHHQLIQIQHMELLDALGTSNHAFRGLQIRFYGHSTLTNITDITRALLCLSAPRSAPANGFANPARRPAPWRTAAAVGRRRPPLFFGDREPTDGFGLGT